MSSYLIERTTDRHTLDEIDVQQLLHSPDDGIFSDLHEYTDEIDLYHIINARKRRK